VPGLLANLLPLAVATAPEWYAHGLSLPAVVPPNSVESFRVELPEHLGGDAYGLELFPGMWRVDVVEGAVPDEGTLPLLPLGRRGHSVGVQSRADAVHRSSRCEFGEDASDYGHLLLDDLIGVAVGPEPEAVVGEASRDDLAMPRLLAPRGGSLRYLLALPLGEIVLHSVADPVAGVVHGLQLDAVLLEIFVHQ
jgi:hypothetical protein